MGAPLREWLARAALALLAVGLIAAIWLAPVPSAIRTIAIALTIGIAIDLAFRYIPSFDPLGRVRWRLPRRAGLRRCAITFDDGPSASTAQVLDILAAEGVQATFFVLGRHVTRFPEVIRRAQAEGHAIGIHGLDHTKLTGAAMSEVERQIDRTVHALDRAGVGAAPVYRTPHGIKTRSVFAVASDRKLTLWAWSRGVWDTDRPAADVLVSRATRLARSGMVLLLHDGRGDEDNPDVSSMVTALPQILYTLKARGFAFVRLADV
jgi:peptidoglycan/xylan/chitin deacetylase (PgdA/CDA1 family)